MLLVLFGQDIKMADIVGIVHLAAMRVVPMIDPLRESVTFDLVDRRLLLPPLAELPSGTRFRWVLTNMVSR
jgi:hypothetical protein